MIDKFLEKLIDGIQTGNWSIVFVVVAVVVVVNLRSILEFLERRELRREEFVKDALKVEALAGAARVFLEEELNYLLFKKVTGIPADKPLREKLKSFIDKSAGEVQMWQLARAKEHLRIKDGKLIVVVGIWDRVNYYFNWFAAIIMAVFGLALMMLPVGSKGISLQQLMTFMGLGVVFFMTALFLLSQTTPVMSARRLTPMIERVEGKQTLKKQT
jgi:hypothetical protein